MSQLIIGGPNEGSDQQVLLPYETSQDEGNGLGDACAHPDGGAIQSSNGWPVNEDLVQRNNEEVEDNQTRVLLSSTTSHKEYVVYTERWFVLAVFSLMALVQSCGWNTWGPIEDTARAVFGWSVAECALLANWGCVVFILTAFFFSWLLRKKGLRVSFLLACGALMVGMGIRCLPVSKESMIWTANVGQIVIALAAPVLMAGVTTVSALWFPTNERTTATAISSTMAYLGVACSFLIGPQIVEDIFPLHMNESTVSPLCVDMAETSCDAFQDKYDPADIENGLKQIRLLLLIEFIWTAVLFVAAVVYFPARPPSPPSASALVTRENMKAGILALFRKRQFWIPALAFSISTGAYNSWNTQMVTIFNNKVDQPTSSWIGFYSNLVGVAGGIIFGRCADYLGGKMKAILLVLVMGASCSFVWALLLANSYIPFSTVSLYAALILFGFFINSTVPLYFEISAESAFPTGEETTSIVMTFLNNIYALIFLVLPMIPSISGDLDWLNWFMLGSVLVCVLLVFFYKEHYVRLQFDVIHHDDDDADIERSRDFRSGSIQA